MSDQSSARSRPIQDLNLLRNDSIDASNIGPPPEAYMANVIANGLMRSGASMFGRKEDATCMLKVGTRRYYVHVQLLAARSPAFRRIFDDMIRSNAWGSLSSDTESSVAESYSQSHEQDYDDDQELMDAEEYNMTSYDEGQSLSEGGSIRGRRESYESDIQHGHDIRGLSTDGMWNVGQNDNRSYSSPSASSRQVPGDNFGAGLAGTGSTFCNNDMLLIPTIHLGIEQLNVSVRRSTRDQGPERDDGEDIATMVDTDDTEDNLPELTVSFTDPEGCRFDEILYWLYTGDNERWLRYFTPANYEAILQIILELRIVTRTVLDICLAFEATTSPELGLHGKARDAFFGPDDDDTATAGRIGLHY